MEIVKAEFSDLPEILELQKLCFVSEAELYQDFTIFPLVQELESIEQAYRKSIFLKIQEGPKIIGSVRAYEENETCFIGSLIVHPKAQGQGLGAKMMKEIEGYFPQCKGFELFTGDKSARNIKLYQKLGYQLFKEEKRGEITFVFMQKGRAKE